MGKKTDLRNKKSRMAIMQVSYLSRQLTTACASEKSMIRPARPAAFDTGASFPVLQNLKPLSSVAGPKATPSPEAQVAHQLRMRLQQALSGVPGALKNAERATEFLTLAQRQLLEATPEQQRPQLIQQFQQENQSRLLGLRSSAASVERPYSPQERSDNIQLASRALRGMVEQSFASMERHAAKTDSFERDMILKSVASTRDQVLQDVDAALAVLANDGASPTDKATAYGRLSSTFRGMNAVSQRVVAGLDEKDQQLAHAEFGLQQENLKLLNTSLMGRVMTPRSPTDLSTLRGRVPPLTGPLNAEQAMRTMQQLESAIRGNYLERMSHLNGLSAEHMDIARFEIEAENARLLATAYRNVLGRLEGTQTLPAFPKG
jgi:hypothetical protein